MNNLSQGQIINPLRYGSDQNDYHLSIRVFRNELTQLKQQIQNLKKKNSSYFNIITLIILIIIFIIIMISVCVTIKQAINLSTKQTEYQQTNQINQFKIAQQNIEIRKLQQQMNLLQNKQEKAKYQYQKYFKKQFESSKQTFKLTNQVCQQSFLIKQQLLNQKSSSQAILKSFCRVINSQKTVFSQLQYLLDFKQSNNKQLQNITSIIEQFDTAIQFLMKQYKFKAYQTRKQLIAYSNQNEYTGQQIQFYKSLIKLNYKIPYRSQFEKINGEIQRMNIILSQYNYYQKKYEISQVTQELPFCIIVPSWNNAINQRYELNLNSLLNQNYTNYKIHIIDDYSSDQTFQLIKRYLRKNNVDVNKVTVQRNQERGYGVKNIIDNAKKYCSKNDIIAVVDGDDELIGVNVLKLFNYFYFKNKLGVAWSNLLAFNSYNKAIYRGLSKSYTNKEIEDQSYRKRKGDGVHMQLRTFKADLLFSIKQEDLKQNGEYFRFTYDQATMFPMQQMSCRKLLFINETTYLYNLGTNNNDNKLNRKQQIRLVDLIKSKSQYPCHKDYI